MSVIVRAKSVNPHAKYAGYYGHKRILPDAEFALDDPKHFSVRWMELVSGTLPPDIEAKRKKALEGDGAVKKKAKPVKTPAKAVALDDDVI